MSIQNEGDLALFNNLTHGEIFVENGVPKMEQGLLTAVYISLFSGGVGKYWGNELSNDEAEHYGGEFEPLAEALDATVENALDLQEAILNDTRWMINEGIATNIEVSSSIENGEIINFDLIITRPDEKSESFKFSNSWQGQFANPSDVGIQ